MLVLGIETSCDETGLAVYDSDRGLVAHTLYSQVKLHAEYGGVVPELASRDHVRKILPMLEKVLVEANVDKSQLDGIIFCIFCFLTHIYGRLQLNLKPLLKYNLTPKNKMSLPISY